MTGTSTKCLLRSKTKFVTKKLPIILTDRLCPKEFHIWKMRIKSNLYMFYVTRLGGVFHIFFICSLSRQIQRLWPMENNWRRGDLNFCKVQTIIFDEHFDFYENFNFVNGNFDFWRKFWFLTKIPIFDENFDFWRKFRFLTKISIFDENFDFWRKFRFLTKIPIFDENFDFWRKFRFLKTMLLFGRKFSIFDNIFDFWEILRFFENFFRFFEKTFMEERFLINLIFINYYFPIF